MPGQEAWMPGHERGSRVDHLTSAGLPQRPGKCPASPGWPASTRCALRLSMPPPCPAPAAPEVREGVARRLLAVAVLLEDEFGEAQVGRGAGCSPPVRSGSTDVCARGMTVPPFGGTGWQCMGARPAVAPRCAASPQRFPPPCSPA